MTTYPWPLRPVEYLPAIGAEILEFPAPGLAPQRFALLYDEDCDPRLREAAAILYRLGLLPCAWALAESKGNLWIAPRQPAPWPHGVDVADDHWSVVVVSEPPDDVFCIQRIPPDWPSREEAAQLLKRMYRL